MRGCELTRGRVVKPLMNCSEMAFGERIYQYYFIPAVQQGAIKSGKPANGASRPLQYSASGVHGNES